MAMSANILPEQAGRMTRVIPARTLTHDIMYAWWHMRRSTANLVASGPSELYLAWLLLLSTLGFMLAWTIRAVLVPTPEGLSFVALEFGALAQAAVVRVAAMYLFALILAAGCRVLGGLGSWRDTRIAVFWAGLVAAPINVALALAVALLHLISDRFPFAGAPLMTSMFYWFGLLVFVWYLAGGVSRVQRFRSTAPCFLYLTLGTLVSVLLALYFRAQGLI